VTVEAAETEAVVQPAPQDSYLSTLRKEGSRRPPRCNANRLHRTIQLHGLPENTPHIARRANIHCADWQSSLAQFLISVACSKRIGSGTKRPISEKEG